MTVESIPAPMMFNRFDTVIPLDHSHEPGGMFTVSPADALVIAVATSARSQELAVMVAAKDGDESSISSNNHNRFFISMPMHHPRLPMLCQPHKHPLSK